MAERRVVARCDADARIGLGHLGRVVALLEELGARLDAVPVIAARPTELVARFLAGRGFEFQPVAGAGYAAAELGALLHVGDVLVSDTYELDVGILDAVAALGAVHVVIDDFGALDRWPCDVVVNCNAGATDAPYRGAAEVLVGTRYALLRHEVRGAPRAASRAVGRRVAVCFGGGRWGLLAAAVLEAVSSLAECGVSVRAAAAYPLSGVETVDLRDLPRLLRWADVGVLSGGVVKYEAAYAGLPSVLIPVVEHQVAPAAALAAAGAARFVPDRGETTPALVVAAVRDLLADPAARSAMGDAAHAAVDGRGAERVVDAIVARLSG